MTPSSSAAEVPADDLETGPSLLLFTFGPVQDFIAAGRRTADLWAGSLLLSRLAEAGLEAAAAVAGAEAVLFPDLAERPEAADAASSGRAAYPNRFLARVPAGTSVAAVADAAERALRQAVADAAGFALRRAGLDEALADDAAREASAFVEVYWAALPAGEDALPPSLGARYSAVPDDAYGLRYRLVESLVGGRKALRDFDARSESGYRGTLLPGRPALTPPSSGGAPPSPDEVRRWWDAVAQRSGGRIRAGERLSAIGLAKRSFPDYLRERGAIDAEEAVFPSTSSFATADFVAAVLEKATDPTDDGLRQATAAYEDAARALDREVAGARLVEAALPRLRRARVEGLGPFRRLSGRLLLGDDLSAEEVLKDAGEAGGRKGPSAEAKAQLEPTLNALTQSRARLLREAARRDIRPPSRYYALLVLDGDKMGEWLSGMRRPDAFDGARGPERHRAISRALNAFALERVPAIVEGDHLGRLIYGGGDDVVALLSFETALVAALDLSRAFGEVLPGGTVSAGLVYAHHLTPLQVVLDAARKAEKRAKNAGRDRLCLTALKRSGGPEEAVLPWDQVGPVREFGELVRSGQVASGLLYDLADLRRRLADAEGRLPGDLLAPLRVEAARLFERRIERMEAAARPTAFARTIGQTIEDARRAPERTDGAPPHPFDAALARLAVAQFLGKGGDR